MPIRECLSREAPYDSASLAGSLVPAKMERVDTEAWVELTVIPGPELVYQQRSMVSVGLLWPMMFRVWPVPFEISAVLPIGT